LESPKVRGLEPIFRHLDDPDVPWQQVRAIRRADGTTASVWEKWLAFSPDPLYLSLYAKWDPGVIQRRHGHNSPHVVMVLEGELMCGDRRCPAATHIELPQGAAFGPFVAGPDGAVLFEVMMGDPRGWGDDPESSPAASRFGCTRTSSSMRSRCSQSCSPRAGSPRPQASTG
jgi:hypothetical protein